MRALANFIMAGRLKAMLVAATSAVASLLLPPVTAVLAYVGAGAVVLVTLRRGGAEGALVMFGALLATGLFGYLTLGQPVPVVASTGLLWLPAWLVAVVLRYSRSLTRALQAATALGVAAVLLVYAWVGDPAAQWRDLLTPLLGPALEQGAFGSDPQQAQALLDQVAAMMTGTVAAALVLGLLLSLMLARSWQALLYNPGGFRSEFHALAMDRWMGLVTVACLAMARFADGAAAALLGQLALVALVPFLFVGLAVIHGLAARLRIKPLWLLVVYGLVLFMPQALVLLLVLGVLDGWFGFRSRVGGSGEGKI